MCTTIVKAKKLTVSHIGIQNIDFLSKFGKINQPIYITQASYGKGPDYFRLKTVIFPISVFILLFSMKFVTELENYQYDHFK